MFMWVGVLLAYTNLGATPLACATDRRQIPGR
jgi:hypothetical protein